MERRVFEKVSKIQKICKIPKTPKIVPKFSKRVLYMFWGKFFEKFFLPSVPWRVSSMKCLYIYIQKIFQNPKTPKVVPKLSKSVLNMFWGTFSRNFSLPSVPWSVESSKWLQKIKKLAKFQKCPKSIPKVSKRVFNIFWGNFFEKFFLPSVQRRVESSKSF